MSHLLRGIFIGLLFVLPAGAVGALTVQRTFRHGAKAGLLTGLGSSAADCFYACVGVFGLTLVSDFLLRYQREVHLLGGGLILLMGLRLLLRKEAPAPVGGGPAGLLPIFLSSFAIGITNPAAILTFLFAFSYFGISGGTGPVQGAWLVCGVFIGTYLWWGALTGAASVVKRKAAQFAFQRVDRAFGILLCLLGGMVFIRTFFEQSI